MKKVTALFLIFLFLLPCIALAAPQTIDIDTMTFNDLVSMQVQIDAALVDFNGGQIAERPKYISLEAYIIGSKALEAIDSYLESDISSETVYKMLSLYQYMMPGYDKEIKPENVLDIAINSYIDICCYDFLCLSSSAVGEKEKAAIDPTANRNNLAKALGK